MIDLSVFFETHRKSPFLIEGDAVTSFGDFYERCLSIKEGLSNFNLKKGMKVGLVPSNTTISIAFIFALLSLEIIPVLLSRRLSPDQLKIQNVDQIWESGDVIEVCSKAPKKSVGQLNLEASKSLIFLTSGSSAEPKMAVLNLGHFYFNALGANANIPFGPGDRWLLSLPLEHVGGFAVLLRSLVGGGSVILEEPSNAISQIRGATHISFVRTQLYRFLGSPADISNVKAVLLGGSSIPDDLIKAALDAGLPIFKTYGLTEMASQVTTTKTQSFSELKTSGRLLQGRDLKIEKGEIFLKGPCLFSGYLKGMRMESAVDSDGWFRTKDRGLTTPDGFLQVLGRSDRMFISAGENIQPEVIEKTFLEFPGVTNCRVVPEEDREYGARPLAYVQKEASVILGELQFFLRERLTGIQMPKNILDWSAIPPHLKTAKDI